ncbi:hypothetical protein B4167_2999 [Caldibacillus thermoamylovorans]|uniref:Uncharacterized protein n=1 Tax=Caldibacillus thermoamylovorans TaxID=35841 RepID=A0ABD4A5R9_9BACI|nr:hypothetical protein B4167_2999 [Caldibacillus thermoamylovorans]
MLSRIQKEENLFIRILVKTVARLYNNDKNFYMERDEKGIFS